jgi:hypothetical protein
VEIALRFLYRIRNMLLNYRQTKALKEFKAFREQLDQQEPLVLQDPRDPLDLQDPQVHKESLEPQDLQVLKDWWVQLDQRVQRDQRDPRVLRGLLERKDLKGYKVFKGR